MGSLSETHSRVYIPVMSNTGDIVSQGYSEWEYDTGFVSNEDNKDYYIMNEKNPELQIFLFVFNDPEALK